VSRAAKVTDFLAKMNLAQPVADAPADRTPAPAETPKAARGGGSRAGLKHIGAYLDRETVEKIALLRARLALDNSQLVQLAIDRLYAAESAKRKFGDA
jgi:hypothetical protein